jgi:hypothetical protein
MAADIGDPGEIALDVFQPVDDALGSFLEQEVMILQVAGGAVAVLPDSSAVEYDNVVGQGQIRQC